MYIMGNCNGKQKEKTVSPSGTPILLTQTRSLQSISVLPDDLSSTKTDTSNNNMTKLDEYMAQLSPYERIRVDFLIKKKVYATNPTLLIAACTEMNHPEFFKDNPDYARRLEGVRARVDLLNSKTTGETINIEAASVQTWDNFCQQVIGWDDPKNVFVFWRDHPSFIGNNNALVQSYQRSGNCYIHAPVILQHYLVSMTTKNTALTLNMYEFIRERLEGPKMEEYVFTDGGNSREMLESILQPKSVIQCTGCKNIDEDMLRNYGPVLVELFNVYPELSNDDQYCYTGKRDTDATEEKHAMIVIGIRIDKQDNKRLLLQNWWNNKQFIEMDVPYMDSCGASYFYVETPQTGFTSVMLTNSRKIAGSRHFEKRSAASRKEGPIGWIDPSLRKRIDKAK